ncbi:YlxR family protein [Arthrobacter mobilis]|uniref:YlxR family protein n=1 Tax=Arthrobacter mobilis TaxID=2724944 RepID=A0A7X6HF91_9MICC|nr:YlxR family protein [Arthrobacter mobilis]NKX56067.1 YlxR family protein [Arthrobacter mobilis]
MARFPDAQKPVRAAVVPQRTCIGCRRRDAQADLLRLAVTAADGASAVVVDEGRRLPGRGAWLHPDPDCMALAVKRRAFGRAFRARVDSSAVESYFHAHPTPNLKAGQKPMETR